MVIEMLKDRLQRGTLEPCHGPYRNPWFIVKKKEKNKYRLINAALDMNKVTIRDANLPPSVDEFSEDFAGCHIASLIDLFVDLEAKTCTCHDFQDYEMPCDHAVALCMKQEREPEDFVSPIFTVAEYKATYQ